MSENRGAFYILAEDITDSNVFVVPGDQVGETPRGTENPSQESYHIDEHNSTVAKRYYVHVKNGWDVDIDVSLNGSSFDDSDMSKAVKEQVSNTIASDDKFVFEDSTGHSYLEVQIDPGSTPTSGKLEVVIQSRYR